MKKNKRPDSNRPGKTEIGLYLHLATHQSVAKCKCEQIVLSLLEAQGETRCGDSFIGAETTNALKAGSELSGRLLWDKQLNAFNGGLWSRDVSRPATSFGENVKFATDNSHRASKEYFTSVKRKKQVEPNLFFTYFNSFFTSFSQ